MKKYVFRTLVGIAFGIAITQIIALIVSLFIGNGNFYLFNPVMERVYETSLNAALVQLLSSSLYGGVFGVSTFVFTKDNWSLVKQTVVHFIIITCTCLLCGWLSFWYPHRISGILIAIGECVVTYFIIWFYFYSSYKKSVSKINELTAEK